MSKRNRVIGIVGPTAVGKSEVALQLTQHLEGEIVSADSVQVYRMMDIGSAKPSKNDLERVHHHLISIVDPDKDFNVTDYQILAGKAIEEINNNKKTPLLVGGTGLYFQAVIDDYDFSLEEGDLCFRNELRKIAKIKGVEYLHNKLRAVDPISADKLHPNDVRRVIRALEVYNKAGTPISRVEDKRFGDSPYDLIIFGLELPREELYSTIDLRVDKMIKQGLLKEVEDLIALGYSTDLKSMQSLGYKEMVGYLTGQYDWNEAVEILKRNTRRYAKRQLTWFKRDKRIVWINNREIKFTILKMLEIIEGKWDILTNIRNN